MILAGCAPGVQLSDLSQFGCAVVDREPDDTGGHVALDCWYTIAEGGAQPTATPPPILTPTPQPTGTPIPTPTPGLASLKDEDGRPARYTPRNSQNVRSCDAITCGVVAGLAAGVAVDAYAAKPWPEQTGQAETWLCLIDPFVGGGQPSCNRWAAYRFNGNTLGTLVVGID